MIPILERLIGIAFLAVIAITMTAAVLWRVRRDYWIIVASPEARAIEQRTPGLKSLVAGWLFFAFTSVGVLASAISTEVPVSSEGGVVPIALYLVSLPIAAIFVGHGAFRRAGARHHTGSNARLFVAAAHVAVVLLLGTAVAVVAAFLVLRGGVVR